MISHAWLEYGGRKVDLTLHLTEAPDVQLPGALIVLDQVLRPGIVRHSYHRERTLAGIVQDEKMMRDPHLAALLKHKAVEHQAMSERARDPDLMTRYLESAPEEMGYEAMAEVLRRFGPPLRRPC